MADSNIGALPLAPGVADDSLLVMEQQGQAMRLTGQMLKDYAKQGVELEFQEYLNEAREAAESAAEAVSSVTEMTVEAHGSERATVTKSMRAGKVNLDFGLPRGAQGEPGPEGKTGPRGPQGEPGTGLKLLGYYDTPEALEAAVPAPEAGDAYGVGTEAPYDIYVFDSVTEQWKNNGPFSGGGGVVPENVVTSEGGAAIEIPAALGDAPHTILITDEEEPALTADDIEYGEETVKDALDGLFTCVGDGKALIASAVTDKGVDTAPDASFAQMAENIGRIQTGGDTSDATATPGDILGGKTAYTASGKVEGTIPSLPAQTITPGTEDKTIANGQYLAGTQTVKGDPGLISGNIKKGVSLFGVAGALETSFAATLTVTADIGAVVTATCGDTSLEALSTTGTVVMELPVEGTWKVTAVRGVAQYNTVTLEVSSQYSAELTAAVHIEYFNIASPLDCKVAGLAAANTEDYAIFGGGIYAGYYRNDMTAYSSNLVRNVYLTLSAARSMLAAASVGGRALFGGGYGYTTTDQQNTGVVGTLDAYDNNLVRESKSMNGACNCAATHVGDYAMFGGGDDNKGSVATYSSKVSAYNAALVSGNAEPFLLSRSGLAAASNENYALFGGGISGSGVSNMVDAYDKNLTRSTPSLLGTARYRLAAAAAGNYVLFGGGCGKDGTNYDVVDAYDLFLTRTAPAVLSAARPLSAASLKGYALFSGTVYTDIYDPYLTHTTTDPLSSKVSNPAAACVGNYALFGGGGASTGSGQSDVVDVYRYV